MNQDLRIIFFGNLEFTSQILNVLKEKFNVVSLFTSPREEINKKEILKLHPDIFVVASFGKILKKEILEIPKYGALNIHPSLLPKYRGASPIQTAILNGDTKTGITIIKMDEKVDHGPILFQKQEEISPSDNFKTLATKLFNLGAKSLSEVINRFVNKDLNPVHQNDSKATFTKVLKKTDGHISLNNPPSPTQIERAIRAYFPWPGVFFEVNLNNQKKTIKLLPDKKIQVEGKKPISYKDFINGYKEGREILKKIGLISN